MCRVCSKIKKNNSYLFFFLSGCKVWADVNGPCSWSTCPMRVPSWRTRRWWPASSGHVTWLPVQRAAAAAACRRAASAAGRGWWCCRARRTSDEPGTEPPRHPVHSTAERVEFTGSWAGGWGRGWWCCRGRATSSSCAQHASDTAIHRQPSAVTNGRR